MQNLNTYLSPERLTKASSIVPFAACFLPLLSSNLVFADSQFDEKAIAVIQSCDANSISGFATLKERATAEGVKQVDIYLQVDGLTTGKHAVHIHEKAICAPCGSAAGHFDPGNFGMSVPDANHPYHSGDLINIESNNSNGLMTTHTSRVTLADGPLSLFDADGSSFIIHDNEDTYCPGGEVAGCAGGSRAACGIISRVNLSEDFEIMVSRATNRSNAVELSNAHIYERNSIYLEPLNPIMPVQSVTFYLDGSVYRTESFKPYDFNGTFSNGNSAQINTTNLSDGTHTIAAEIRFTSGDRTFVSSQFNVVNNFAQAASGDSDDDD